MKSIFQIKEKVTYITKKQTQSPNKLAEKH